MKLTPPLQQTHWRCGVLCWKGSHAEPVFDIMLDQYGIWLGISTLICGDTQRLSQRLHPYAVPLIREAVKLGCIPTSLETVSLSLLSLSLSPPPLSLSLFLSLSLSPPPSLSPSLSLSAHPAKAFFWEDGTTNVALIGSHHLHAAPSFFFFQWLRLLFIFFRWSCRNGLEIPQASISHMWSLPVDVFWLVKQALYLRGCFLFVLFKFVRIGIKMYLSFANLDLFM